MRCDQMMGLPPEAIDFLKGHELPAKKCPCCNRPYPKDLETIGEYTGMFEDKFPLYRYRLIDGGHADEYLQAAPWSSGPCFFIGLKIGDMTFEWTDSEIANA